MRFCQKSCVYVTLIFFAVFFTSAANKAFADQTRLMRSVTGPVAARAAIILFVNQMSDMSDISIDQGLASIAKDPTGIFAKNFFKTSSFFKASSYGESYYETEDYDVSLESSLLLLGFAKRVDLNYGQLFLGAFYNYGNNNYDVLNRSLPFVLAECQNDKYKNGGLFGRFNFKNNLRGELSGHIGNVGANFDFRKNDKYNSLCLGWHAGLGYLHKFSDKFGLDIYGKYFFMRQKGKDVKSTNGDIEFFDVDSKRLKIGAKLLLFNVNPSHSLYAGGAYEYEFDGNVNLAIAKNINTMRFKGGTQVYEAGATFKNDTGDICVDIGAQGCLGLRECFAFTVKISIGSLNFFGLSAERFEKEKAGRFEKFFNTSQKDCFDKSLKVIEKLEADVVHESFEKGCIVAFNFSESFKCCLDKTEVCIFITDAGSGKTKVEVVSDNNLLAKDVSVEFFKMLEQQ